MTPPFPRALPFRVASAQRVAMVRTKLHAAHEAMSEHGEPLGIVSTGLEFVVQSVGPEAHGQDHINNLKQKYLKFP